MARSFLGRKIVRIGGLLEASSEAPPMKEYSALIGFEDGSIVVLGSKGLFDLPNWPDDADDMPTQSVDDDGEIVGSVVTNAFTRIRSGIEPQQFLVLDGRRLLGLVPTQLGTPLVGRNDELLSLDGQQIPFDDLVIL